VVRDDDSLETIALQNRQDAYHIDVALVDEGFPIVRHFSGYVAEMDVSDFALAAVLVNRLVDVSFRHFG
jgi:hypothetical protein